MTSLLEIAERMVEEEKKYAAELEEVSKKIKHPVLEVLLKSIALDSKKHSSMYEAIVKLLRETQPALSENELKVIAEAVKKHIETESRMIELTRKLLEDVKDSKIKLIVAAIHEDEVKHHKILVDIKKNIAEKEIVSEQELWDALWKDSPWHGGSGG